MLNPITKPVLTLEEKRDCVIDGVRYMPAQITDYHPMGERYTIAADWARYQEEGCDTDLIDFDDMQVPALLITTITGGFDPDPDSDDPLRFVGLYLCLNF